MHLKQDKGTTYPGTGYRSIQKVMRKEEVMDQLDSTRDTKISITLNTPY